MPNHRQILMKTDEGDSWVEYLGTDAEWERIRAEGLHETRCPMEQPMAEEVMVQPVHQGG